MTEPTTSSSWIYQLKKDELVVELEQRNLETGGTVDTLRRRLVDFYKAKEPASMEPKKTENTDQLTQLVSPGPPQRPLVIPTPILPRDDPVLHADRPPREREPTDADIIDQVRKWNVHFDGGADAIEFLERMEELAGCYAVPLDRLPRTLPDKLRGRALEWCRNTRGNWHNWDDFTHDFRAYFLPRRYQAKLEDEIRRRVQGPREKGKDFVTTIQTMYRRLGGVPEDQLLERLYDNLRIEYRHYIRPQDFQNLADFLMMIEQYEELVKDTPRTSNHGLQGEGNASVQARSNPFTPPQAIPTAPTTEAYNPATACWNCGRTGHRRFVCPNPRVLFCSRCGRKGMSRDCPCSPGNAQGGASNNPTA